jgi:hypothetical protein
MLSANLMEKNSMEEIFVFNLLVKKHKYVILLCSILIALDVVCLILQRVKANGTLIAVNHFSNKPRFYSHKVLLN